MAPLRWPRLAPLGLAIIGTLYLWLLDSTEFECSHHIAIPAFCRDEQGYQRRSFVFFLIVV
jgi:hypothetical protein